MAFGLIKQEKKKKAYVIVRTGQASPKSTGGQSGRVGNLEH